MSVFSRHKYISTLGGLVILVSFVVFVDRTILAACAAERGGTITSFPDSSSSGYFLLSPYIGGNLYEAPGEVKLINRAGVVLHTWATQYQPLHATLEDSGDLYVAMTPPIQQSSYPSGGTTGLLQKLNWDGKVEWEYSDPLMTHDYEIMPNGNIAYTVWESAPAAFANQIRGGMDSSTTTVWTTGIVVINPAKEVVWKWRLYEHVDPHKYILNPLVPKMDWAHTNSIRYVEHNPITQEPAFLISVRHISKIMLINAATGAVIWESPDRTFSLQHDATLLESGNILVFDNGLLRVQARPYLASRVVEINPRTNKIEWEYSGGITGAEQVQFASSIMGSAQRLPNGDTLITSSSQGKIFEVTSESQIVWEYNQPFVGIGNRRPILFKVHWHPAGKEWEKQISFFTRVKGVFCS